MNKSIAILKQNEDSSLAGQSHIRPRKWDSRFVCALTHGRLRNKTIGNRSYQNQKEYFNFHCMPIGLNFERTNHRPSDQPCTREASPVHIQSVNPDRQSEVKYHQSHTLLASVWDTYVEKVSSIVVCQFRGGTPQKSPAGSISRICVLNSSIVNSSQNVSGTSKYSVHKNATCEWL